MHSFDAERLPGRPGARRSPAPLGPAGRAVPGAALQRRLGNRRMAQIATWRLQRSLAFEVSPAPRGSRPPAGGSGALLLRKLDFAVKNGVITKVVFTKRPGWSSATRALMPSSAGYDRGHLIPWMAIRLRIERNLDGVTLKEAYNWLAKQDPAGAYTPTAVSEAAVKKAIEAYGRAENNDLDNLEYEDSSDNRSAGAKLPGAADIWDAIHGTNGKVWSPPYKVTNRSGATVMLTTKKQATEWCLDVGVPDASVRKDAAETFSEAPCAIM
jgi:hypothetical protein